MTQLMNLQQKILKARIELAGKVKKQDTKMGSFFMKTFKVEDVVSAVSKTFCELGLLYTITKMDVHFAPPYTHIKAVLKVEDTETGQFLEIEDIGSGMDTQDKASGKASSYVLKKLLMQLCALQDQEDTDMDQDILEDNNIESDFTHVNVWANTDEKISLLIGKDFIKSNKNDKLYTKKVNHTKLEMCKAFLIKNGWFYDEKFNNWNHASRR